MPSLWRQTAPIAPRPPLQGDLETEAAVIGGGLAGILTAALLRESGVDVVVLEADRIGSGQTENTTAKVTCQHGMLYHRLEQTLGQDSARLYAGAGQQALEWYQQLIWDRRIDCEWERLPAYLYTVRSEAELLREFAAQERAGLPVRLTEETGLPFPTAGAVRCENQAQLHPLRLLHALAEELTIREGTRVLEAEGDQLRTTGGTVRAEHIIFCCHFPFVNAPGYYFLRMHQERSYVLALRGAPALPGMYYSADPGGASLRMADGLLLVGGGAHRTGENREGGKYEALRRWAGLHFPDAAEAGRWSAQDCMTLDGMPYMGRFAASTPCWYVATGFGKWGMTAAMAAAHLIRDQIFGQENAWAQLFSPSGSPRRPPPDSCWRRASTPPGIWPACPCRRPGPRRRSCRRATAAWWSGTAGRPACTRPRMAGVMWWTSGAPTWAASWSGIRTRRAGTVPATAPGSTAAGSCSPAPPRGICAGRRAFSGCMSGGGDIGAPGEKRAYAAKAGAV